MAWLQLTAEEVDPEELSEWEHADPDGKGAPPEAREIVKTFEVPADPRITFHGIDGYQSLQVGGPGGISKIEFFDEDPNEKKKAAAAQKTDGKG